MATILSILIGLIGTILGVVLTKITETYFEKKKDAKLFIANFEDIISWGWSGKKLLQHLIALDYETTDNLSEKNEGTSHQWAPVFMNNPNCWKLLAIRPGEIVGYWSYFALKEEFFRQMKQGIVSDSQITIETVEPIECPGIYNIYIVIICIKEHYRKSGYKLLHDSFIDNLNDLTNSGCTINEVCINAFTDIGEVMCKNFGLKKVTNHSEFGIMYASNYTEMCKSRGARNKLHLPAIQH